MDRGAFFRALPFLTPVSGSESSVWPPRLSGSVNTNIVLKDHVISVEPNSAGPACFASSHKKEDPAMVPFAMCIIEQEETAASPAASSVSTSLSLSQSPKVPSQGMTDHQEQKSRLERLLVVFRINRQFIFQVDLGRLGGIDLHENASNGVPNLALHFSVCSFRIFSEESLTDNGSNDDYTVLKAAASRIKRALSCFQKLSLQYPRNEEHATTPLCQSSNSSDLLATNKGDAQGKNGGTQAAATSNQDHEDANDGDCPSMRRVKRKRTSLDRSWNGLHSLEDILNLPRDAAQTEDDISEMLEPVLTTAAEELAQGYCRKQDVCGAVESCNNDIALCEQELNQVFCAGFPPPTRNRRNGASPAASKTVSKDNTQDLLETTERLLKKQKEALKKRLELSLLPIRE